MDTTASLSTDALFKLNSREARNRLDAYRRQWEEVNGPTDASAPFTSQAPDPVQDWLIEHRPQQYFDGLPPFVQDFFIEYLHYATGVGTLDTVPDLFVRLYVSNGGKLVRRSVEQQDS